MPTHETQCTNILYKYTDTRERILTKVERKNNCFNWARFIFFFLLRGNSRASLLN